MMFAGITINYTVLHLTISGCPPGLSFKPNHFRQMLLLIGTWCKTTIILSEILSGQRLIIWVNRQLAAGIIRATHLVSTGNMIFSPGMALIAGILIWQDGENPYH